ncbi:MAG: hypothetical protein WBP58_12685 [Chitinophagaceae bacterium]
MLRGLFAIICLLAFAGQTFSQALVVADYYFNTDAYKASCENKAKPQMKCHGKCQMAKKITQQEKKESQQSSGKYPQKGISILSSRSFFPVVPSISISVSRTFGSVALIQLLDMPRSLLRPPDRVHAVLF